jgi:hypothetical protein
LSPLSYQLSWYDSGDNIMIGKQGRTWDNGSKGIMPHGTTLN